MRTQGVVAGVGRWPQIFATHERTEMNDIDGNPMYTGHLPRLRKRFEGGVSGTNKDRRLGEQMLARLEAAHDGTRDGIKIIVPWEEWDGYCMVVNDRSGG